MSDYLKNFLRFCIIILIQVLVLNKITLRWWSQPAGFPVFIPYIYPLFILLLPFETPVWLLLLCGFATGLTMDTFMNTAGIHACATVLIAYLRTNVLSALLPKHLSEYPNQSPGVKNMGWVPFLTYCAFLILIHHSIFFTVELWNFSNIGYLLLKIIASTATSLLFILAYLLLFTKQTALKS
ncbi:MAG: rod shape-determining protein MreD [Bacteroidetes bacterium]|nr:rod shape-determining protein MreD [Bacteroidota bacterium]MBS1739303.1 rod shape-determining protein MreD [Bacteroidota bacterium]MBS1775603.1 rod shape-determining protein MreD [Bacteroidota bacterium]